MKKGEDWYQRLLRTMNDGFSIRDENPLFTFVNDKFCEILGYTGEEHIGRPIVEFVDPLEKYAKRPCFR